VPLSFSNDQLSYETETDDESASRHAFKSLSVTVSNTVTPYESEVDSTPRQTPLKKRLGFSMYFRGKMKSSPMGRTTCRIPRPAFPMASAKRAGFEGEGSTLVSSRAVVVRMGASSRSRISLQSIALFTVRYPLLISRGCSSLSFWHFTLNSETRRKILKLVHSHHGINAPNL
jgi:hypothetical protein